VIGAPRGNPGFELPANFPDGRRAFYGLLKLDLQNLPGMALRALDPHLSSMFHYFGLIFHRIASVLALGRAQV
jgi:hypothetical protein